MTRLLVPILLVFAGMLASQAAFAYSESLENELANAAMAKKAVEIASQCPDCGSGTPYLAADGVVGASAITASVFGEIAVMFFIRGRNGRYVAQGRG